MLPITTDNQNELFYHVDENDTVIGPIKRFEAHDGTHKIHRSIAVLVFNKEETKILLQQRSMTKDTNPGMWTISTGGHLTFGDSYDFTAKKELAEEIGLDTSLTEFKKILIKDENETEFDTIYTATADENFAFTPHPEEVQQLKWIQVEDLKDFLMHNQFSPCGRQVLEAYFSELKKESK